MPINLAAYPHAETPAFLFWQVPGEGETMRAWHAGRCAMCDLPAGGEVLDHCHWTGVKRGYLCVSCNQIEARSDSDAWHRWRAGLNPARLLGEDDLYISPVTGRPDFYTPTNKTWIPGRGWLTVCNTAAAQALER